MNRTQQAAAFYAGLRLDLVTTAEITSWADSIIEEEENPEYEYIELSTCPLNRKDKFLEILKNLKETYDFYRSLHLYTPTLLKLIEEGKLSPRTLAQRTYEQTKLRTREIPGKYFDFFMFDEYYEMAESGVYGGVDEVTKRFTEYLNELIAEPVSGHNSGGCAPSA